MHKENLDSIVKRSLGSMHKDNKDASLGCPSDEDLSEYVDGVVSGDLKRQDLIKHVSECDHCFSKTASAVSALAGFKGEASVASGAASVKKAKSIPKMFAKKRMSLMKRNKYLFVAAGFFLLSFIFKVFFLQFLAAASIFGIKWAMDTGGSKALIMIYDTWQHRKTSEDEREGKERFKDRRV
ncbi:MAG: hypothetical protein ABH843_03530 [Candidatus Omnitrophota bacterium]